MALGAERNAQASVFVSLGAVRSCVLSREHPPALAAAYNCLVAAEVLVGKPADTGVRKTTGRNEMCDTLKQYRVAL